VERVLILEDEPFIAMDLQLAFDDAGVAVVVTGTCSEAFEALADGAFNGAVLDVNLGDGQTCHKVALELGRLRVPFLLNTGDLNRAGEFLRGIKAPIIPKPTRASHVVERLLAMARPTGVA
jgi:DNA-binding response OmpR family regulator